MVGAWSVYGWLMVGQWLVFPVLHSVCQRGQWGFPFLSQIAAACLTCPRVALLVASPVVTRAQFRLADIAEIQIHDGSQQ